MFETIAFEIKGITQHVQHNGQLADSQCRYVVEMKKINAKGKKRTDEDFARMEDLEWEGSLYLDHEDHVIVTGNVIEGAMFEAGKATRQGQVVRNAIQAEDARLIYSGPQDLESLKADRRFRHRAIVVNPSTRGRVARTRPIFREWSLKFSLKFDNDLLNEREVIDMVYHLGGKIGLSDDRRKMGGRFKVISPVLSENGTAKRKAVTAKA